MTHSISANSSALDATNQPTSGWRGQAILPWLGGSGIALGQAALATACTVPTLGQCAGCGSCALAVATLTGWALKRRNSEESQRMQGLEPFEIRSSTTR